jgi:hypothetical protein
VSKPLHGNDVDGAALLLNGKPVIDFAACLYRLALTGFLDLHFNVAMPPADQTEVVAQFINQRREFMKFSVRLMRAQFRLPSKAMLQ